MAFSFSPKIVTDGLVLALDAANSRSYVSGSTAWNDLSPSLTTGSLINGPIFNFDNGGSIQFDGINDFVELGNPISLDITESITHVLWIYPISYYASGFNGIFTKANSSSTGGSVSNTLIYISGTGDPSYTPNRFYAQYGKSNGTAGNPVYESVTMTYNVWANYTSTYDGSNVILYKNGVEISRAAQTGTIYNTNQNTGVKLARDGRYNFSSGRQFNGRIGCVYVYKRALSATEVLQNYNALKSRFNLT